MLNGVVGSLGLAPTLPALRAGRTLALANKESLVAGGPLVRARPAPGRSCRSTPSTRRWPSACASGGAAEVRRLILTASGGPFRGARRAELTEVTPEQALAHPTWNMGPVVTINSATLVNKGLEVIEAHELFGVAYDDIEVMVHPQSVIHSMVSSSTGRRSPRPARRTCGCRSRSRWAGPTGSPARPRRWTGPRPTPGSSSPLDEEAFPAVALAKAAGRAGRCRPAIYNAANEECVAGFTRAGCRFWASSTPSPGSGRGARFRGTRYRR